MFLEPTLNFVAWHGSWFFIFLVNSQVEELIKEDSRIDQYPKVVKGEQKVVYEWQGMNLE